MASLCKIQVIGNVGRDPEQRYTQSGSMVVSFSVAVNNRRRNPDGSFEEETEWFRITTFGRLAETCQQLVAKGRSVFVDGRLRVDRWTGQDGQQRFTLDVIANDVVMMDPRPRGDGMEAVPGPGAQRAPSSMEPNDLDDLPF
jgi:single-strand DNA-binding protein